MKPKGLWWKAGAVLLMVYALPMAWLGRVSVQVMLHETIRNLYFHVTMWFSMTALMLLSAVWSVKALARNSLISDLHAASFAAVAFVYGLAGIVTGMIWARFTWGDFWTNDPKLNGAAAALLIYAAYFILRSSVQEPQKRLKVSAVYNIFSFIMLLLLIGLMPRLTRSLHPGNGGNPGFGNYDLAEQMRPVFYALILGFTALGAWLAQTLTRIKKLENQSWLA
ncbi:MAG: cytochrome c biogenesis protein CcsA [Flavobacteriales bacterium]|nr:cytochrome c biogenesis protein CcsA [Flavobacteriales bacterium]MCX7650193.1 cytochrome c biogenesis protein CcsA [Flavobacteriales bacterium]MDW8432630.1 cytochrome c biogenesis protein CcsA [Flavobacteriales bacterium]